MSRHKILLVCMGNICRSPAAEGLVRYKAQQQCVDIMTDSAGTHGYHIGARPDPRSQAVAVKYGFSISDLRARKLIPQDGEQFDLILVMDQQNFEDAIEIIPTAHHGKIKKIMSFVEDTSVVDVPDPYYGQADQFEYMMQLLDKAVDQLLVSLSR